MLSSALQAIPNLTASPSYLTSAYFSLAPVRVRPTRHESVICARGLISLPTADVPPSWRRRGNHVPDDAIWRRHSHDRCQYSNDKTLRGLSNMTMNHQSDANGMGGISRSLESWADEDAPVVRLQRQRAEGRRRMAILLYIVGYFTAVRIL